jgi:dienelactone hydrolase
MSEIPSSFAERGPFPVGVIRTSIDSPYPSRPASPSPSPSANNDPANRTLPTEIWYPAEAGQGEREDAHHPMGVRHRAGVNLAPRQGLACPLIGFSHGNSGLRQQSTFLTTHLASWGIVVVAPDHVGNTFSEMMALPDEDARKATHRRVRGQRPHDLHAVIQALLDGELLKDELPRLDGSHLGLLGHSFGGWTTLKVSALEARVKAICCLAPASEPFVGRKAFDPGELPLSPDIESLILAARDDVLVDLETSIRPLHDRLGENARLEIIERSDHFHFCDGIEMLHGMHENNPRENQLHPTRPLAELRDELDMHTFLNERVMRFFGANFGIHAESTGSALA